MDAKKNPAYLTAVSKTVTDFRDALVRFLALHVVNDSVARGIAPAVFARDDANPSQIAQLSAEVGRAAGLASDAPGLTNMFIAVQGAGKVDPIAAWQTITQPKPLLEAADVLGACDQIIGRLNAMALKAEAELPPTIGTPGMHPLIWAAASRLWRDDHFRASVAAAADALVAQVKTLTGRNDVPETSLWQETFSEKDPQPGKPRLRWPGDPKDRNVRTMNEGLRLYAPGVQMTIRNPAAHSPDEMLEQEALERLAALSLLGRWVDACQLITVEGGVD